MATPNWVILATNSGGGGSPPTPGVAGGNVSAITVTGFIDPVSAAITLTVSVTPPSPLGTFIGCHIYLEVPDQSSGQPYTVGSSTVGGSDAISGPWSPIDCGKQVYVASQQPWTLSVPGPPTLDPTKNWPARIYCVSFSTSVENQLVEANQTGASPNQTFTLISLASGSPTAGTNITNLTTVSGAQVGIVATALSPVNVNGKLQTPVEVIVTDVGTDKGWCYRLCLTYAGQDPTLPANQFYETGVENQAGPVPAAGSDGVDVPHSFIIPTPTTVTQATVWLIAGLVDSNGNFQGNNLVPGITPQFGITFGSTVGTTDASSVMTATIAASMAVVNGLFGVASGGITNSLLGAGAVATINIQNLAITNPLLASLCVQAAQLASGSVTATAIAAAAVGTAAIQNAAITNALIANLAVSGAQIQSATITGANIASATIAGANIGTATIAQANMASASIGTAQIQSLAVTDAKINDVSAGKITAGTITATISITSPVITVTSGSITLNLDGTNILKIANSTNTAYCQCNGWQWISQSTASLYTVAYMTPGQLILTSPGTGVPPDQGTLSAARIQLSNGGSNLTLDLDNSGSANPLASTASAGSATLPANPVGFLILKINGTSNKIPYYAP
jgi:hypothetical protein